MPLARFFLQRRMCDSHNRYSILFESTVTGRHTTVTPPSQLSLPRAVVELSRFRDLRKVEIIED
jgi:hypothetical protein